MRELWARLTAGFSNLSGRERVLVMGAGGALLLALLYVAVVLPVLSLGGASLTRVEAAKQQLRVMERLRREFDDVHERVEAVEQRIARGPKGNLRTTLESLARKSMVQVESMEPQASPANDRYRETKVEVGLKSVSLPQIVSYLHQLESAPQVLSVKTLRIRTRADQPELLDVTFTVSSFERI